MDGRTFFSVEESLFSDAYVIKHAAVLYILPWPFDERNQETVYGRIALHLRRKGSEILVSRAYLWCKILQNTDFENHSLKFCFFCS